MAGSVHIRTTSFAKGKGKSKSRSSKLAVPRPSLLRLLLVGVLLFLAFSAWHSSSSSDEDEAFIRPERPQDNDVNSSKAQKRKPAQQYAKDRDIWTELPEQQDMEIINPLYSVRVLRSIMQHSNRTWQDQKGECQGYFVQSLMWLNIVGLDGQLYIRRD